jgi:hypothetical protein
LGGLEAFEDSPALEEEEEVEEDDPEAVSDLVSDALEALSPDSVLSAFFRSSDG